MKVFCGIDWAEDHHDVALVDADGALVAKRRIDDSAEGFAELLSMLADAGDTATDPIPVAIETPRGLLVAAPATDRATGLLDQPDGGGPLSRATQRLAEEVRPRRCDDLGEHPAHRRPRAPAPACRQRTGPGHRRAVPRHPGRHLAAIPRHTGTARRAARVLPRLPRRIRQRQRHQPRERRSARGPGTGADTRRAAKLTKARVAAALRRAGRQRGIDALAAQLLNDLRKPQLRQPPLVEEAFGRQSLALLATLNAECASADQLTESTTTAFQQHPDYAIITSFPGLADLSGARVLGEIGDDRARFTDARSLKAYAGSAPVTRASGRSISITRRTVKNDRLNATGFVWAFASIGRAGAPREHYHRRRAHGDRHAAALRHLFNRFLGQLHHCLQTGQTYDPAKAFDPELCTPTRGRGLTVNRIGGLCGCQAAAGAGSGWR